MSKLIVKQLNSKMESVNCAYCGSDKSTFQFVTGDYITFKKGKFDLVICDSCGLSFLNPRPNKYFLYNYYYSNYSERFCSNINEYNNKFDNNMNFTNTIFKRFFYRIRNLVLANHFDYRHLAKRNTFYFLLTFLLRKKFIVDLIPKFIENGRILEIGCSYGLMLRKLTDLGWKDLTGIELSENAANICKKNGFNVICSSVEDIQFPARSFDVIIMSMVLEHLADPFLMLEKIEKWLKPMGQLLFSVPNANGYSFKIFKNFCYISQSPYHLYYFSDKIIKKILEKNYLIQIFYQRAERDLKASLENYLVSKNRKIALKLEKHIPRIIFKILEYLLSLLKSTSRISVICNKKNIHGIMA